MAKSRSLTASSEFSLTVVEAEFPRGEGAIDRKRGAGERRAAERHHVDARAQLDEPFAVAQQHFEPGHDVMPERHRLGRLQMRETRA